MRSILRVAQEEHNIRGVKEIMKRLETYCKDRGIIGVYKECFENPPVKLEEVKSIEAEVGQKLPSDYLELMKLHDGTGNNILGWTITPIEGVGMDHKSYTDSLKAGYFKDSGKVEADKGVKPVWWSEKWVPFALHGDGNCLVFDFDPAAGGKSGQVVEYHNKDGERRVLAGSFVEWFDKAVDLFIEKNEQKLEKEGKEKDTTSSKKSWWPW